MAVDIPEPFRSALREGCPLDVCDAEAPSPDALYGRAMARLQVGQDVGARADLDAATPALGDTCRIELVYLDIRERALETVVRRAEEILERVPDGSPLKARAYHIVGLARGKLRRTESSTDALISASELYRDLGDRAGHSQVQDTLGTLHASRGVYQREC